MPRIRYQVAMSLDGYIAGPKGEADWIVMDPDIDFEAQFAQFDTFLMGRRTFEVTGTGGMSAGWAAKTFVFSRTLRPDDHPGVTIVREVSAASVAPIRAHATKVSGCVVEVRSFGVFWMRVWSIRCAGGENASRAREATGQEVGWCFGRYIDLLEEAAHRLDNDVSNQEGVSGAG